MHAMGIVKKGFYKTYKRPKLLIEGKDYKLHKENNREYIEFLKQYWGISYIGKGTL